MPSPATLQWEVPAPPRLQFCIGVATAFAWPPTGPGPIAVIVGPQGRSARWLEGTLGDGVADEFILTHNFNSYAVGASFWLAATGEQRQPDFERIPGNPNAMRVAFATPPTPDQYGYALFGPPTAQE